MSEYDVQEDKPTRKLFRYLERAASEGKIVTYEELGDLVDMLPNRRPFTHRLGSISEHTWQAHGVVLTSIVVQKHDGVPSDPYFNFAKRFTGESVSAIRDRGLELETWARHVREAHKHYRTGVETPVR